MSATLIQHSFGSSEISPVPGIPPAKIIISDPPYNLGIKYADDATGDRLSEMDYWQFCYRTIQSLGENLLPGGTLWWLCPSRHMDFIPDLLSSCIGRLIYRIVKQETFSQYRQKTLTDDYRMLFVAQKPGGELTFNPDAIRIPSARMEYGDKRADPRGRVPGQVWTIRRLQGNSLDRVDWHPAQLPPELIERIILGWSNPGDDILDAFAGSGVTGVVCQRHARNFYGVDQSPTYIEQMKRRLGVSDVQAA